ncbi:MAG: prepilin-type N-terminal cleavage/methylation domain-containing protein [Oscillospiraceae bacterium]|jgi:prepilin-type N-terminal cleavage/methylation domain-containing protein|nr:prepilin-type N-terminal cleavage/methylation domain-containing protein [Oscillospiraceae bacterium]
MRRDNRGYSLIELIVVIALLGILVGIVTSSLAPLLSARARRAAFSADSLIAKCKVFSMSRTGDVYVRIYRDARGVVGDYYEGANLVETEILGSRGVVIAPDSATVSFNRATGGLKPGSDAEISFSAGARTYTVTIITSTGRHGVTS